MTRRRRIHGRPGARALLQVLVATCCGCGAPSPPEPLSQAVPVTTERVRSSLVQERMTASGRLEGRRSATLSFAVAGEVGTVRIVESDHVREGELLLGIREEELRARVEAADAEDRAVRAELERVTRLREAQATSNARHELLTLKAQRTRAELALAQLALDDARIFAPFSGHITRRYVERYEFAHPGQPAVEITEYTPLILVVADVPARAVGRIQVGDPVTVAPEALTGRTIRGRVSRTAVAADPDSGTFEIEAEVPNADAVLRPGMIARVVVTPSRSPREHRLSIPIAALVEADGEFGTAFRVVDGVARSVEVRLGAIDGERVVILGGLSEGTTVIVDGSDRAKDGDPVQELPELPAVAQFGH